MYAALIAPRMYVQGNGVLKELGKVVKPLGKKALVIADRAVADLVGPILFGSLKEAGLVVTPIMFGGECSTQEINRIVSIGKETAADVVIGLGGGKTLDTAKAAGFYLEKNWVSVPTVASSDAPTSALAVIYTADGTFEKYLVLPKNPDLVVVDTGVIAQAPARFLSAGIGDGLSTWVECRANLASRKPALSGGIATKTAATLSKLCWDTLFTDGIAAVQAVERKVVTPAVESVVEAATLLSGLGFESGGLAAAHAVHNGLTVLHEATHHLWHGEKVAFGTITQLALESRPTAEINELIDFCIKVKLPTTLADLNLLSVSRDDLKRVAEAACADGETIHNMPFTVTPEAVLEAILAADAYGQAYKASLR